MSQLSRTLLVTALLVAGVGAPSLTGAQSPQKPPAAAQGMKANTDHMAAIDAQLKTMREMHEKMVNAKSPEERNALMAEHMKTMQGGMATMNMMGGTGMAGMGSMQGGKPMAGDMNQRQQMMEKRMEMMQSMMQMMMDRMPATPAK